jgi:hypothetical protein
MRISRTLKLSPFLIVAISCLVVVISTMGKGI